MSSIYHKIAHDRRRKLQERIDILEEILDEKLLSIPVDELEEIVRQIHILRRRRDYEKQLLTHI